MPVPGSEPEPGPVAPPALSLPPLRDLDKDLTGSEAEDYHHHHHHQQPRTQSSDPHLHQHFQRTESHRHYKALPQLPSPASSMTPIYQHDRQSQYSSSAGSLPDMYANSPSAPSSTTTSTFSRANSVSTMEYLQTSHPHGTTRIDQTNTGASHHITTHTSYPASSLDSTLFQSINDASKPPPPTGRNTKGIKGAISAKTEMPKAKSGSEGRNSTKRAAQNRAAQRAFRQRKDLYVRELERKAELLPAAESKVASLTARVEQLEAALAAAEAEAEASSAVSSSLSSPQPLDSPIGLVGTAKASRDRDWEWESDKPSPLEASGALPDTFNRAQSSIRRIIPRHSSSHQLRQAYNSPPSPSPSNGSKHSPHPYYHGGSDQELDASSAHRHLRRHPSESSLTLRMREQSLSTSPGDASGYRSSATFDSRMDIASPPPSGDSQFSFGSRSSTLPVPSGRQDHSSTRPYPSSPLTPSHERSPLYSIPQSHATGARSGLSTSPNSNYHSRHITEEVTPSSFTSPDLSKKRPSEGVTNWGGQDLYRSAEDATDSHLHHQVKKQSSWTSLSEQYRNQSSIRKQQSLGSLSDRRLLHQQHSPAIRDIQYYRDNSRGISSANGGMTSGSTPLGSALSPISGTFNFSPKIHHSGSASVTLPPVSALSLASPSAGPRDLKDDDVAELSPIHAGERHFPHNHYHHRPMLHHRASTNSLRATKNNQRRPSWPELGFGSPGSPGPSGSDGGNWTKMKESPEMSSSEGRFSSPALPALPRILPPYAQKPPLPASPMTFGSVSSSGAGATSEHEQGSPYPYTPQPHVEHRQDQGAQAGDTEMMHDSASFLPTSPHRHQRQGDNAMDLSDDPNEQDGTPMGSP
ncbi:hypothetical protein CPB97_007403 [Podila verticillata]|nr:hypothetical protein CPB97_007403 [Podila verticillata]